jgi:hypothetical protein
MESQSIISSICWIPKGFAKSQPKEYEIKKEDLEEEELEMLEDEMPVFSAELGRMKNKKEKKNDE